MAELRLEELYASNIVAANNLSLKPGQEQFIAPVTYSAEASVVNPDDRVAARRARSRTKVVGFIHGNFDPENAHEEFRACIWRINVDAEAQGKGVGRFLAQALAEEAKRRGFDRITVMWEPGEEGPEAFFHRIGFVDVGETAVRRRDRRARALSERHAAALGTGSSRPCSTSSPTSRRAAW